MPSEVEFVVSYGVPFMRLIPWLSLVQYRTFGRASVPALRRPSLRAAFFAPLFSRHAPLRQTIPTQLLVHSISSNCSNLVLGTPWL
jgi:hypothetical protein